PSRTSFSTASLGRSPTSAQPPGGVHCPSSRPRTSSTRRSRKTTPRTSTFGVACPYSAVKAAASGSTSAPSTAAISAAILRTSSHRSRSNGVDVYCSPCCATACSRRTHSSHPAAESVKREVDERDHDRAGEQREHQAEQRQAPEHVLPCERRVDHASRRSIAIATNSRAR